MTYVFLNRPNTVKKKLKKKNHQHPLFEIFLSRAKTKIIKKKNLKTINLLKKVVQMTKGGIITHIFKEKSSLFEVDLFSQTFQVASACFRNNSIYGR